MNRVMKRHRAIVAGRALGFPPTEHLTRSVDHERLAEDGALYAKDLAGLAAKAAQKRGGCVAALAYFKEAAKHYGAAITESDAAGEYSTGIRSATSRAIDSAEWALTDHCFKK